MKKVLITGASGLLGRAIFKAFSNDTSWEVIGLAFSRAGEHLKKVDITNKADVSSILQECKPDIIIHSAAERRPDNVENKIEETKALNVDATGYLCKEAARLGSWVLYISTDYVFDGQSPPHNEIDKPNPLNKYGLSKRNGEIQLLTENKDNGILRIPILYGDVENLDESAITVLFKKVKDTDNTCLMSDYERRFPAHCDDVAAVCKLLADKRIENAKVSGVYHFSGDENMTKYTMALSMAEVFNLPTNHIKPDTSPSGGAPRPYNAHLGCSRLDELGITKPSRAFKQGIKACLEPYL